MKHNFEKLHDESEQATFSRDVLNERYANQVVDILNDHPPTSWVMGQRGTGSGGTRDFRDAVVRIITSMTVNPEFMNKTEIWHSINRSAHNQESSFLFKTCVDLAIMDTEKSKAGVIRYVLHPVFLDQLEIKPQSRKFQKIQRWHFNRDNVFLPTTEDCETEYRAWRSAPLSSVKQRVKDDPWRWRRKNKKYTQLSFAYITIHPRAWLSYRLDPACWWYINMRF